MKKTIGGDRLGSGKKMQTDLHNYERSTHNLSASWRSSMAPGTLVPFLSIPAINGDTFDIDLDAMARTIPTIGPLFGGFKLQLDVFTCPVRLYIGKLHNNALNVGMNMANIRLPYIHFGTNWSTASVNGRPKDLTQFSSNCLSKYLGLSGLGRSAQQQTPGSVWRNLQCLPELAYYDIFKNYYANKQEENAYVITPGAIRTATATITGIEVQYGSQKSEFQMNQPVPEQFRAIYTIYGSHLTKETVTIEDANGHAQNLQYYEDNGYFYGINTDSNQEYIAFTLKYQITNETYGTEDAVLHFGVGTYETTTTELHLQSFKLQNIDLMREMLLSYPYNGRGESAINVEWPGSGEENDYPYLALWEKTEDGTQYNAFPMNGLCVKTYQSDLFNNWVNTDWIDGENGIAAITAIDTTSGSFNLDTLNLAQKVYNMLNRIAISGGTYEDWQEAVYGEEAMRRAESPIYLGGMSSEIVFEEVISTADTDSNSNNKLGSLAGKGRLNGKKGGHITIKITEPSYVIGIVSITPRIDYTQGNSWDRTELITMNDFHKPELDGIGFQNLMNEQMAWWDVTLTPGSSSSNIVHRGSAGKVPAWINYMTNYDKAFGDFADKTKTQYMILARDYGYDGTTGITDLTTYIDPTKYNYAFAYTGLDAQNFWLQIYADIKARRKMSAKVIPNL